MRARIVVFDDAHVPKQLGLPPRDMPSARFGSVLEGARVPRCHPNVCREQMRDLPLRRDRSVRRRWAVRRCKNVGVWQSVGGRCVLA